MGTGGGTLGDDNAGVQVQAFGSTISSGGGNVMVTGQGGGSGSGGMNVGVSVSDGALITAGNTGDVTVNGAGGASTGQNNFGVYVAYSARGSRRGGGEVMVTGQGGERLRPQCVNYGVYAFVGGQITAGGMGKVPSWERAGPPRGPPIMESMCDGRFDDHFFWRRRHGHRPGRRHGIGSVTSGSTVSDGGSHLGWQHGQGSGHGYGPGHGRGDHRVGQLRRLVHQSPARRSLQVAATSWSPARAAAPGTAGRTTACLC